MAYNDGKALTSKDITWAQDWMKNTANGDPETIKAGAKNIGLNNNQMAQLGIVGSAWNDGKALNSWEIQNSREWAKGKDGSTVANKAMEMGATPEQFGQIFGWSGADSTVGGYGTSTGLKSQYQGMVFDGSNWYKPSSPGSPSPVELADVKMADTTKADVTKADVSMANTALAGVTNATVTPWNVTPDQLVEYRANNIIRADSPMMQQARGAAMQQMNERGLINSSLAVGAAQDAVMGKALDIARPDAQTSASAAQFNANAGNTVSMFNAGAANSASQFNAGQTNTGNMFNANAENEGSRFNAGQTNDTSRFNAGQANENSRFNANSGNEASMFNAGQTNTFNLAQQEMAQRGSQFDRTMAQKDYQFDQDLGLKLKQLGLNWDIAQMDDATRRMLGQLSASTAGVAAGISAAGQMAIADADHTYRTSANKTQYLNNAYGNYQSNVLKITLDPSLEPDVKTRLINAEVAGFKTFATMNDVVGDFSFVDAYANTITGKNAGTPAATTTTAPATAPATAPVYQPELAGGA